MNTQREIRAKIQTAKENEKLEIMWKSMNSKNQSFRSI